MEKKIKNKYDKKDVAKAIAGGGLLYYSKNPLLGTVRLYHGTTKENAKSIRREGLLRNKANVESGATKWLADYIQSKQKQDLLKKLETSTSLYDMETFARDKYDVDVDRFLKDKFNVTNFSTYDDFYSQIKEKAPELFVDNNSTERFRPAHTRVGNGIYLKTESDAAGYSYDTMNEIAKLKKEIEDKKILANDKKSILELIRKHSLDGYRENDLNKIDPHHVNHTSNLYSLKTPNSDAPRLSSLKLDQYLENNGLLEDGPTTKKYFRPELNEDSATFFSKNIEELIKGNTSDHTFVTKIKPHGRFYAYMSDPKISSSFINNIIDSFTEKMKNIDAETMSLEDAAAKRKDTVKGMFKDIGKVYLKAQLPFSNTNGKNLKLVMPMVKFKKEFLIDTVSEDPVFVEMLKNIENQKAVTKEEKVQKYVAKILKTIQAKTPNDIDKKYFARIAGPGVWAERMKLLPEYIKSYPGRFAAGVGGTALAGYLLKDPAIKTYENVKGLIQDNV